MKVQKLVFLTHGFYAAEHDEKLMVEDPEVWPYGPVYKTLYSVLKWHRSNQITEKETSFTNKLPPAPTGPALDTINEVWKRYRDVSGVRLSDITHMRGTPWQQIAEKYNYEVPHGTVIPYKIIRKYFKEHAEDMAA